MRKKNNSGGIMLSDFKLYYKSVAIKTVWYGIKTDTQINGTEQSPEIKRFICGQLIYDKGVKNIQWGKDSLFNKWCWENWTPTHERMKLDHFLTPYTKINSKRIKVLNVRPEVIKILEETTSSNFPDIRHGNIFLAVSPEPRETKAKTIRSTSK